MSSGAEYAIAGAAFLLWLATWLPVKRVVPRIVASGGEWAVIGAETLMLAHLLLLVVTICALVDGLFGG